MPIFLLWGIGGAIAGYTVGNGIDGASRVIKWGMIGAAVVGGVYVYKQVR